MTSGYAQIAGTWRNPRLELTFSPFMPHPEKPKLTLLDWVKSLPGRRWDPERSLWVVTGVGRHPDQQFREAGFEVLLSSEPELASVTSLQDLYTPVTMLSANRRTVLMRHRLAGYDEAVKLAGGATSWDKKRGLILVHVADAIVAGGARPGIIWTQDTLDRALELHNTPVLAPGADPGAVARLGGAASMDEVAGDMRGVATAVGHLPSWFGMQLFGYQKPGALAVAAGHTALFDAPGVGKTLSFLAAAAVMGAERTLVICPPVVLTNWARETVRSNLATEDEIAVFRSGRKEPDLAGKKVVIVADSLLASRPETAARIADWGPNVLGYDEAHRAKTIGSKRSEAILNLVAAVDGLRTVALTGTPMMAGPHEMVPLLELTGHLAPVFGGRAAFLARYSRQDRFGGWHTRKEHLPELRQKLRDHVWVRRTKAQVLPDLPGRSLTAVPLDIDLAEYRKAHAEVGEQLVEWLEHFVELSGRLPSRIIQDPGGGVIDEISDYAQESLRYVSQLRRAAGLTKIATAAEMIETHVSATSEVGDDGTTVYTRPLIVWTHHQDVTAAMAAATQNIGAVGVISGGTSDKEKNRVVDEFQAGRLAAVVCSITAAGVGITLTRSSDVLFVESDWTPALVSQAIDRAHRVGQENHITVQFLLALGTLDEHVQRRLDEKGVTLSEVFGEDSSKVGVMEVSEELQSPKTIVEGLIEAAIKTYARKHKTALAA